VEGDKESLGRRGNKGEKRIFNQPRRRLKEEGGNPKML